MTRVFTATPLVTLCGTSAFVKTTADERDGGQAGGQEGAPLSTGSGQAPSTPLRAAKSAKNGHKPTGVLLCALHEFGYVAFELFERGQVYIGSHLQSSILPSGSCTPA